MDRGVGRGGPQPEEEARRRALELCQRLGRQRLAVRRHGDAEGASGGAGCDWCAATVRAELPEAEACEALSGRSRRRPAELWLMFGRLSGGSVPVDGGTRDGWSRRDIFFLSVFRRFAA